MGWYVRLIHDRKQREKAAKRNRQIQRQHRQERERRWREPREQAGKEVERG